MNGIQEVTGSIPVRSTTFQPVACNEIATDSRKAPPGAFSLSGAALGLGATTLRPPGRVNDASIFPIWVRDSPLHPDPYPPRLRLTRQRRRCFDAAFCSE